MPVKIRSVNGMRENCTTTRQINSIL